MKRYNPLLFILFLGLLNTSLWAQKFNPTALAKQHIINNLSDWGLSPNDVTDLQINDYYQTRHNGLTHIYFLQHYQGIEIYNAMVSVHVRPEGQTMDAGHRLFANLSDKVNATHPLLSPEKAVQEAARYLGMDIPLSISRKGDQKKKNYFLFEGDKISNSAIPVRLLYFPKGESKKENVKLLLAWDVAIDDPRGDNYWSLRVDALTGEVIDHFNQTIHCRFGKDAYAHIDEDCNHPTHEHQTFELPSFDAESASYNVFAFPIESPSHGSRSIVTDPADPVASPDGWHDVNGTKYTTTRGNNVNTVWNRKNSTSTSGDEPDGGANLDFNFPYDKNNEPNDNGLAATTNLFYASNFMHDFTYHYGFDEAAGNFQAHNYTDDGNDGDPIRAITQYGADIPATPNDGNPNNDYINNANFTPLPDGSRGTMRMYAWNRAASGEKSLNVITPASIAGSYGADVANFGTALTSTPVTGEVVEAGTGSNHQACSEPDNAEALEGKIALIDRGSCDFSHKVYNVQQAGAIAAIICNFEDALIGGMGSGQNGDKVTIPSIFVKAGDCTSIRQLLSSETVSISLLKPDITGPDSLDGSFDNGIIAHEYAHGISNRLTGGPNTTSCLREYNEDGEQMGEGWSDFFALVATVKESDVKTTKRGIGTFVFRQDNNGQGVRDYPYTTDMSVNPSTYEDIFLNGVPYGPGTVWASVLWDLYWAFVEEYDWSADLYNGDKGNNMVIQLVMDAMKIQPCDPSMVDGRQAILIADEINNGGANACLIWEVFANRGIGFSADAGTIQTRFDNYQSFDKLPSCITELKIEKSVTSLIEAGEEIEVSLIVTNHKLDPVNNVMVSDELPEGVSFMPGSSNKTATTSEGAISFDLGTLASGESDTIRYKMNSDANLSSLTIFYDDMENNGAEWFQVPIEGNKNIWALEELFANSGSKAWAVSSLDENSKQDLQIGEPITLVGNQPAIRFFHKYDTEPAADGGFVELSTDNGNTWFDAAPYLFRNPYRGAIQYTTFAIPNLDAYWGDSEGFIESYIDLSDFQGEEVMIQFKFATDDEVGGTGWFIDDVEYMDLHNYNGQACVSSNEGDNICAIAPEKGTIVLPGGTVPTSDPIELGFDLSVFPNPAKDLLNLNISGETTDDLMIQLISIEGRLVKEQKVQGNYRKQLIPLQVNDLPAGFYLVRLSSDKGSLVRKVVVE